jgi:uncharacterized membrane protein YhiD involved in acid resistance
MDMLTNTISWMETLSMLGASRLRPVLSGVIGYEREHVQRNAGMRTHILVRGRRGACHVLRRVSMKKLRGHNKHRPARMVRR